VLRARKAIFYDRAREGKRQDFSAFVRLRKKTGGRTGLEGAKPCAPGVNQSDKRRKERNARVMIMKKTVLYGYD